MDGWDPSTMMEPSMNTSDAEGTQEEGLDEVRFHYCIAELPLLKTKLVLVIK